MRVVFQETIWIVTPGIVLLAAGDGLAARYLVPSPRAPTHERKRDK